MEEVHWISLSVPLLTVVAQGINHFYFPFCYDLSLQLACKRWVMEAGLLVLYSPGSDPKNSDDNMNVCSQNLIGRRGVLPGCLQPSAKPTDLEAVRVT